MERVYNKSLGMREMIDRVKNVDHLLFEEVSKETFYSENRIDPENLSYLGSGDFGEAYSIGDGRVLKTTMSKNEYAIAQQMENNEAPILDSLAKIYKTGIVDGAMIIILEEVDEDSHIEDLFYELSSHLDDQELPIQYLDNLDTDDIDLSEEMVQFMNGVDDILRAYRYLGIEASDIRPENMGYSKKDGRLMAFDIDDKRG